jgi:hypothetical protein
LNKKVKTIRHSWYKCLRVFWRRCVSPIWQDIEWPVIGSIWIFSLILGYIGFSRYYAFNGENGTGWDFFYRSIQLMVLEYSDMTGQIPWQLEIARWIMPAVAAYAAIQALLAIFRQQWQLFKVRFFENHVIVCGLGERGLQLSQEFLDNGYQVVVIE